MAPDCYVVLGVPRDASLSRIRRAFRELSRRFDVDHADPGTISDVEHAYCSLADPAERAEHDRVLASRDAAGSDEARTLGPARDLAHDFHEHNPSLDAVMQALERDYLGPARKSHPMREIGVEVVLSPQQAKSGGVIPFNVPAATPCPACDGTGQTGFFRCDACHGAGATWTSARVDVVVPRGTPPGTRIPVSLASIGAGTLYLNVTVQTRPDA